MSAPLKKEQKRTCNICGLTEDECLQHDHLHPSLWNLSRERDEDGDFRLAYKHYEKLHKKQLSRAVNLPPRSTRK